jgi:hypothetical protein
LPQMHLGFVGVLQGIVDRMDRLRCVDCRCHRHCRI